MFVVILVVLLVSIVSIVSSHLHFYGLMLNEKHSQILKWTCELSGVTRTHAEMYAFIRILVLFSAVQKVNK